MNTIKQVLCASLLLALSMAINPAISRATDLTPYLNDDTFLVAQLSVPEVLEAIPSSADDLLIELQKIGLSIDQELDSQELEAFIRQAHGMLQIVKGFGLDKATAIIATQDIHPKRGPILLLTMQEGREAATIALILKNLLPMDTQIQLTNDKSGILIGSGKAISNYQNLSPTPRPDLTESLAETSGELRALFSLGLDARRVIRELWPTLPGPFKGLTGDLLADQTKHAALSVRLSKAPHVQCHLEMTDSKSAKKLLPITTSVFSLLLKNIEADDPVTTPFVQLLKKHTLLSVQENRVVLTSPTDEKLQAGLFKMLSAPIASARESARQNVRLNQMKQLVLAMLNSESTNGQLPAPAAICDAEGKPLLSWRVALLPFIEGGELYNQFHLDEPWNSEHNLELAKQMPRVYQRPGSNQLTKEFKTTYLRPIYDGHLRRRPKDNGTKSSAKPNLASTTPKLEPILKTPNGKSPYYLTPGLRISDYFDGTSNTLLIAQVAPEHAEVWTKPADWEVDLDAPKAMLFDEQISEAIVGFVDGHTRIITPEITADTLRKLITHDGKEPIDYSEIK